MAIEALSYWISGSNSRISDQIQTLVQKTKRSEKNSWELGSRYLRYLTPPEEEFQVNTYTLGDQMYPAIASLTDGGFVITWQSADQDGSYYGIYAQRYKSSNEAYDSEFRVNSYTTKDQKAPTIAGLSDGGFVIAWQSADHDGSWDGIYAQRYTSSSEVYGVEFQVNTYTTGYQDAPAISGLSDGGYVITWQGAEYDGWDIDIYAQRYSSLNMAYGLEFRVNTYTPHDQKAPEISSLSDGGFIITWESFDQDGSWNGVYAQRYTLSSLSYGSEFQVNTYTNNDQETPAIAGLSNGGYVITWESSGQDNSWSGIYGKQFSTADVVDGAVKSTPESSKPGINSNSLFVIISIALPVSVLVIAGCVFCFRAKKTANLSDSSATFYYKPLLEKSSQNGKFLGVTKSFSF